MNSRIVLTGLIIALLPVASHAAPGKAHKVMAAATYQCSKCHMNVSASVAKKDHFKDPMDGGTLVPVKTAKK